MKIEPEVSEWIEQHDLLVSCAVPRPIAWVSTIGPDGVFNLAPYSLFTVVCIEPMMVGITVGRMKDGVNKKDTQVNIEFSKDFVINVVTEDLAEAMNQTSFHHPSHVDEFKEAGLTPVKADLVKSPMVAESPMNVECRLAQILDFGELSGRPNSFIIGEVLRFHIEDELWVNGEIQMSKMKVIGRLGGHGVLVTYCRTGDSFEMERPDPL
jgi:flavin reductase (DIM6/NTAB) family NADH-FMN oxidoreductase RutF